MKNNSVTKSLSIEDFFKIYPDIIPKNENFDEIHKFYDIFKGKVYKFVENFITNIVTNIFRIICKNAEDMNYFKYKF